jgi:DNA (cytosine-5)-methyltransferase 1
MKTFATMFSGFGGADVGLMAAGLRPLWGIEYDADIAGVYRNNIGAHVIIDDVRNVDYSSLPHVDWLHASPSCVRASVANVDATESAEDTEAALAVVRALQAHKPQVFTLENVWGYRNFSAFRLILGTIGSMGYFYDFEHVNAADFGVPQTRRRLILRATRGLLPPMPAPAPWVGWYEAIADLLPTLPNSKLAPWQLARLRDGVKGTLLVDGKLGSESTNVTTRDGESPCFTVTTSHNQRDMRAVLVNESSTFEMRAADGASAEQVASERNLKQKAILPHRVVAMTPRCLARFQSFPDSYQLPDKRSLAAKGIGNAVPPLLMQRIAEVTL